MNYKIIKKNAKTNIKHNYFKNVIVIFICTILLAGGINLSSKNILNIEFKNNTYKSNSEIIGEFLEKINEDKENDKNIAKRFKDGVISVIVNEITTTKTVVFNFLDSINKFLGGYLSVGIVIIVSNVLLILFRTIFIAVYEIGKNRYFLEQRRYLKTNIDRTLFPYKKKKTLHLAGILFLKNFYLFLWSFTIIGFFIKYYEYIMIPYVLAENPNISRKDAFKLSKELMNNEKFNLFKIDLLLLVYKIPGLFTFNLTNIFFTDIYAATIYSEFYMDLKKYKQKKKELSNPFLLNDKLLEINNPVMESYPTQEEDTVKRFSILNIKYEKKYNLSTYILFFFSFSFIGYIWEVLLNIVKNGSFVNRGILYGPWLPIYGFGGIAILYLLKRIRKHPFRLFLLCVLLCGVIEYSTGWYLETFRHLKYWDYSNYYLNLHGRICLEGLIVFGLGGCAITYIVAPILDNLFNRLRTYTKNVLILLLIIVFLIDVFYSSFIKPHKGIGIATEVVEKT